MIPSPFSLFAPFADRLSVALLTKEDRIMTDEDAARKLEAQATASMQQTHGNKTVVVHEPVSRFPDADGIITDTKDLTLLSRSADCQSFAIYHPEKNIVGLLHAGWKGVANGAIPEFFKTLTQSFDVDAADVFVGAAPSLCKKCAEFTDPHTELPTIDPKFFNGRHVDLIGAADAMLIEAGVLPERIERMPECTKCDAKQYYSCRSGDGEAMEGYRNVLGATLLH